VFVAGDAKPNPHAGCGHPTWHQEFPGQVPWQTPAKGTLSAILYAESEDGIEWVKPDLGLVAYGSPPPAPVPCVLGSLGGGDIFVANLTLDGATAWCANVRQLRRHSSSSPPKDPPLEPSPP